MYPCSIDGKQTKEYKIWSRMLERCNPNGWQQKNKPAYIGCEVHPDFIKFQDFAEWCQNQIGFGKPGFEFDKDILMPGNKVYGPYTCVFVPTIINKIMIKNDRIRGDLPIGVSYDVAKKKYRAEYSVDGKSIKLGRFDTVIDASLAYKKAKTQYIEKMADMYKDSIDPRAYAALLEYLR